MKDMIQVMLQVKLTLIQSLGSPFQMRGNLGSIEVQLHQVFQGQSTSQVMASKSLGLLTYLIKLQACSGKVVQQLHQGSCENKEINYSKRRQKMPEQHLLETEMLLFFLGNYYLMM